MRSALAEATSRADRAALALGCTTSELPEAAERHARDARLSARALLDLRHELAPLLGSRLAAGDDPVPHLHRPESDMAFLGAIAAGASRAGGRVVLVTGGETPGPGVFVLAGPHEGVQRLAARLRERLGVRGGGPEGRFQGKVSGIEELVAAVRAG